jgi:hypothetical protein
MSQEHEVGNASGVTTTTHRISVLQEAHHVDPGAFQGVRTFERIQIVTRMFFLLFIDFLF